MQLLDHVSISVDKIALNRGFYDAIMSSLGCDKVYDTEKSLGYGARCSASQQGHSYLTVYESEDANVDDKRHWCFKASSQEMVIRFYQSGVDNGGSCNGGPGLRSEYHEQYFGAFLYDPFGNRVEAVYHGNGS